MGGNLHNFLFFLLENADLFKQSVGLIWSKAAGASALRPAGYVGDQPLPRDLAAGTLGLGS